MIFDLIFKYNWSIWFYFNVFNFWYDGWGFIFKEDGNFFLSKFNMKYFRFEFWWKFLIYFIFIDLFIRWINKEFFFVGDGVCFIVGFYYIFGIVINDNIFDDEWGKVFSNFCDEMVIWFYFNIIFEFVFKKKCIIYR